jgi:hypothetical protein
MILPSKLTEKLAISVLYMCKHGTVRYGTVRYGTVWYGTVRYGTVRYGTVRYGTVRLVYHFTLEIKRKA